MDLRIRFTYPVASRIHISEDWPVCVDQLTLVFQLEGERIVGLYVECPLADPESYPKVKSDGGDTVPEILIPDIPEREVVRAFLRRVQSFLSMYGGSDIDFEKEKIAWLPENDQERENLKIYEVSLQRTRSRDFDVDLSFDFVAGMAHAAYHSSDHEIPLSFVRRARRNLEYREFFYAYYNFFFFLETKYFPGYSDPRKISAIIKENIVIIGAIEAAKSDIRHISDANSPERKFADMSLDDIVDLLVRTRGNLHHHAERGSANWHPEKSEQYEGEAVFLGYMVNNIALNQVIERVYFERDSKEFLKACEDVDAIVRLRLDAIEIRKDGSEARPSVNLSIPGKSVHMRLLDRMNKNGRDVFGFGGRKLSSYDIIEKSTEKLLSSYKLNKDYFE